ncbi:unnamed protein product [Effrenium voratum]|nr:unnamed protein product [Effrenium voratum]
MVRMARNLQFFALATGLSGLAASEGGRELAVEYLDIDATPDMSFFNAEAQVARDVASFLSLMGEKLTPLELAGLLQSNLLQYEAIFGSAIAFEPDSYPWNASSGSVSARQPGLELGVLSRENGSFWANMTEPWSLPRREIWPGERRVLYCPYMARGGILMDLADAYNYFDPSTEWYHAPRTHFLTGEVDYLLGMWGSPYFDEGAGNIEMVTYSVPFTRKTPVPIVQVPEEVAKPFGLPENRVLKTPSGDQYLWGIVTVDIHLSRVQFRCAPGQVFNELAGSCQWCPQGTALRNSFCEACEEYEESTDNRLECHLNGYYLLYAWSFCIFVALATIPPGAWIKSPYFLLQATHEQGGLVLHLCNKHSMHMTSQRISPDQLPTIRVYKSGYDVLDKPSKPLRFKISGDSQIQLCADETPDMCIFGEACQITGYARFPLWWELWHLTTLRVPIVVSWILALVGALAVLVLWAFSGAKVQVVLASLGVVLTLSLMISVAIRWFRAANAFSKQKQRIALLKEKELIRRLSDACWKADQRLEHDSRLALEKVGWTETDLEELTRRTLKCQSQEAGVGVAYLLSDAFSNLAKTRSNSDDPNFYVLKDAFFFGDDPIGKNIPCPRDARLGCALVDALPRHVRRQSTHYLSWTWKYTVGTVQDALSSWLEDTGLLPEDIFLYMCFFVNNQYRILYDCNGVGSVQLEEVFESTLKRIGNMVAILDGWRCPVYLTRIWTIFEQFTAIKLGNVPVTIVLPREQNNSLIGQIREGEDGILQVTQSLCAFESVHATAFLPQDEETVKERIRSTIGFEEVDEKIRSFMLDWVGNVVQEYMKFLMSRAGSPISSDRHVRPRRSERPMLSYHGYQI